MKQTEILKEKINKCNQHTNFLEILLAVKCFLTNDEENPCYIFQSDLNLLHFLNKQTLDYNNFKESHEKYLSIASIKPIELILLAKNKKIKLLSYIDATINNLSHNIFIIIDKARTDPFKEDFLFNFLSHNEIDEEILSIYRKREKDKERIIGLMPLEIKYYKTCSYKAAELKILDYWKNIWGLGVSYKLNKSIFDDLIM